MSFGVGLETQHLVDALLVESADPFRADHDDRDASASVAFAVFGRFGVFGDVDFFEAYFVFAHVGFGGVAPFAGRRGEQHDALLRFFCFHSRFSCQFFAQLYHGKLTVKSLPTAPLPLRSNRAPLFWLWRCGLPEV